MMTIVLCGSGSGGHITPLLAVAKELKKLDANTRVVYIGEKRGKYNHLLDASQVIDEKYLIYSGKFRRYHNESLIRRITDLKTIFLNLRDLLKVGIGLMQSMILFRRLKADTVLLKGGSVCLPAGLGARMAGVFTVTHDSDALPGVSNRVGGRHAEYHATAMPAENYQYPKHKVIHVGLPIDDNFVEYSDKKRAEIKDQLGIKPDNKVLLITGGSGGAMRLNQWCADVLPDILLEHKDLNVVFVTGRGKLPKFDADEALMSRVIIIEFADNMPELANIADVVVSRAGATTLNEFATLSKAVILVPNPDLTGGHQVKNALAYQDTTSAIVVEEQAIKNDVQVLGRALRNLLTDEDLRTKLGANLHKTLPKESAAYALAKILLEGRGERGS